jgi:hypothetical protein
VGAATAQPVVGGTFGRDRGWVRARLDDLIERGPAAGPVEASLLILQARPDQGVDIEARPYARRQEQPTEIRTPSPLVADEEPERVLLQEEWEVRAPAVIEEWETSRG